MAIKKSRNYLLLRAVDYILIAINFLSVDLFNDTIININVDIRLHVLSRTIRFVSAIIKSND